MRLHRGLELGADPKAVLAHHLPQVVDAAFEGVEVETDLGAWRVIETPGHAPSHVVLHLPERRLLISGDHVLGRIAPYFDRGFSPDPVGEFLASLDRVKKIAAKYKAAFLIQHDARDIGMLPAFPAAAK